MAKYTGLHVCGRRSTASVTKTTWKIPPPTCIYIKWTKQLRVKILTFKQSIATKHRNDLLAYSVSVSDICFLVSLSGNKFGYFPWLSTHVNAFASVLLFSVVAVWPHSWNLLLTCLSFPYSQYMLCPLCVLWHFCCVSHLHTLLILFWMTDTVMSFNFYCYSGILVCFTICTICRPSNSVFHSISTTPRPVSVFDYLYSAESFLCFVQSLDCSVCLIMFRLPSCVCHYLPNTYTFFLGVLYLPVCVVWPSCVILPAIQKLDFPVLLYKTWTFLCVICTTLDLLRCFVQKKSHIHMYGFHSLYDA